MMNEPITNQLHSGIVTIKVGSALLVDNSGIIRANWLSSLASDITNLRAAGAQVIVVTSGSIPLGRRQLALPMGQLRLEEKQAAAAVGQIMLASAWRNSLAQFGIKAAQILVTPEDTEARRRYLNARATISTLLSMGAVPVVNENDTVATSEIRFGDNDRLSARVAIMAGSQTLILLSDVDGLYTADPTRNADARHIAEISEITPEIEAMAGGSSTAFGTGGMNSKIEAAKMASRAGTCVILCKGNAENPVEALKNGARHSHFAARGNPLNSRKQWISASLGTQGWILIDQGASTALRKGASLLPAGIIAVEGDFERGDAVMIADASRKPLAKGLSAYDSSDAAKIMGRRSSELSEILGWQGRDAAVHRDDMVLL